MHKAIREQHKSGRLLVRDSLGLPCDLGVQAQERGQEFSGWVQSLSRQPSPVGGFGSPSRDKEVEGSWSTEEDSSSSQPSPERQPSPKHQHEDRLLKKPGNLGEWFCFKSEPKKGAEPADGFELENTTAQAKPSVHRTSADDATAHGPMVIRGFNPVSGSEARAILKVCVFEGRLFVCYWIRG